MSPDQKTLVRESWNQVMPIADTAAALFYRRLFELDPDLSALFVGVDLASQRRKLVQTLTRVVVALDDIADLVPEIEALGRRHAGYGVTDAHYQTVGEALLWTLETGLGEAWTPDVETAWTTAYGLVADVMRGAAAEDQRRRAGDASTAHPA